MEQGRWICGTFPRWKVGLWLGCLLASVTAPGGSGALDLDFDPGRGADDIIRSVVVEPSGALLVGGSFRVFHTNACHGLVRLRPDGRLDPSFTPSCDGLFNVLKLLPGGRILVGGSFTSLGGLPRRHLARLDAQGEVDAGFAPVLGDDDSVWAIASYEDGRLLAGGYLTESGGQSSVGIVRLLPSGQRDPSFAIGAGASGWVGSIVLQPNQGILIGGDFLAVQGVARSCLARLRSDGTLDSEFAPRVEGDFPHVASLLIEPDGAILIAGRFSKVQGRERRGLARLFPGGELDESFAVGGGLGSPYDQVQTLHLDRSGHLWIGGSFQSYNGQPVRNLGRLNPDGTLDPHFRPFGGVQGSVGAIADPPDGSVVAAGDFRRVNHLSREGIARFFPEFTVHGGGILTLQQTGESYRLRMNPTPPGQVAIQASEDLVQWTDWVASRGEDHQLDVSVRAIEWPPHGFFRGVTTRPVPPNSGFRRP